MTTETQDGTALADELLKQIGQAVGDKANVSTIFGDPVDREGITVIPVAKARFGFGGGGGAGGRDGEEGSGGGGGGRGTREPGGLYRAARRHRDVQANLQPGRPAPARRGGRPYGARPQTTAGLTGLVPLGQAADDGPGWIRTTDLGIKSPLLCQLSYRPARRV